MRIEGCHDVEMMHCLWLGDKQDEAEYQTEMDAIAEATDI